MDILLPDERRVRLDEVAKVPDTVSESRALAEQDGRKTSGFKIFRARDASEPKWQRVRAPRSPP
jgi:multidrug efflux pump subunit AcrB